MRRIPVALVFLLSLSSLSSLLGAQTPVERASLDSIRASFANVEDSLVLIRRERDRIAVARVDRDNPFIHMELGWLSYRLGELTGSRRRYQDAASEFQWAADLRPQWPYAWYHLGQAELSTGEAGFIVLENLRQVMGQDFLSMAVRSFSRAVEADPTFSFALVELAQTAMRQRLMPRLQVAVGALRAAASGPAGRDPAVLLWRTRIERRTGTFDSALVAARRYLDVGGDSGLGGLELARTQAQLGRIDSARVAYALATHRRLSDTARAEMRRDIKWIALPDELAEYDALPADSAGPWLDRYWRLKDAAAGRRPGERLAEQFRRYQYAQSNYALATRRRGISAGFAYNDASQQEFDDRGVIYIRHGEPTRRATYAAPGIEGNESWLYRRPPPEDDLILHFSAVNDVSDYRLMESLRNVCARGFDPSLATQMNRARDTVAFGGQTYACVQSRASFGGIYDRLGQPGGQSQTNWASERTATRVGARQAVATDSYIYRFTDDLDPVVSYFAIAGADGGPELHVIFALPADRLHAREAPGGGFTYQLALRMTVYDSTGRVFTLDTLRTFRSPQRLGAGAYLTEQLAMSVPHGPLRYSFVVEEPQAGTGAAVTARPLDVPDLRGGFSASDVVMGREGSGLIWRRAAGDVPLNPLMRYTQDSAAVIYYELYGLPEGSNIATRVRIARRGGRSVFRRVFGGGGGGTDLAYTTVTDANDRARVRQRLELRGLTPGRYELLLELVEPNTGRRVERRTPFEITGR